MNKKEQLTHFNNFINSQRQILLRKGDDYSQEDRLSNFKLGGEIAGITPAQHCLALISTKVARLGKLLKPGVEVKNEAIRDTVVDLANYAILLDALLEDEAYHGK